jgi:hypothetical protein
MHNIGFVYILTNPFMPNLVKIGHTGLLAEDRANDLFTTGVPAPFTVEYRATTSFYIQVENRAHEILSDRRVNKNREFFAVSVKEAIEAVRFSAIDAAGIASWKTTQSYALQSGDRLALNLESGQSFVHIFYRDEHSLITGAAEPLDIYQAHSNGDLLEIFATDSVSHVAGFTDGHFEGASDPVPYIDRERKIVNGMINGRERLLAGERLVWLPSPEQAKSQSPVVFDARDHCQIVSRTWSPKISPDGLPMLLNAFTHAEMPPELVQAVMNGCFSPNTVHFRTLIAAS